MLSATSRASRFLMEIMTANAENVFFFPSNIYSYTVCISHSIKENVIVTYVPLYATGMAEVLFQSLITAEDNSLFKTVSSCSNAKGV